ncbi:MAG: hypothetical protein U9R25_02450 [Chloroflexota bacterium]|nr:hypothetical protein [Chloroflexota bacterium]
MIFSAVFALIVGISMIGMWSFLLLTKQVPELETEPLHIRFHIAAEFVTAIALVAGGVGLLTGQSWSQWLYLVAIGMLFYTVIVSPGYYAEKDEWPIVAMFAVILVLALASLVLII